MFLLILLWPQLRDFLSFRRSRPLSVALPRPAALPEDEVIDEDPVEEDGDQIPVDDPGVGSSEKIVTLVVLISIFGIFVIVILALCCTRRSAIGKPNVEPIDPMLHWTTGASSYTGVEALSQFSFTSEAGAHDHRIDL
jgi:hypothetical protein